MCLLLCIDSPRYFHDAAELFIPGRSFKVQDQYPAQLSQTLQAFGAPPFLLQRLAELDLGELDWTRDETEVDIDVARPSHTV